MIESFRQMLMCACLCGLCVSLLAWLVVASVRILSRLPKAMLFTFLAMCLVATGEAQKNTNLMQFVMQLMSPAPVAATVSPEDIARGWRVEGVATNAGVSYAMPGGVSPTFDWHRRGTFGEWRRLDLGDFAFPFGTNGGTVASFSVFSDGRIRPTPRDAEREIRAVGVPMLAMQGASRFWTADGACGAKLLTWESFFLGADTNAPVSAQVELRPSGDFVTRSNGVETVCRRVNPDDWDGDGIHNERDARPTSSDGDHFGAANALPANANPDAYYWLDVCATGGLGVATVRVTCDGPSDLGDHVIVARTNEVCHIPLLAGATYLVESDLPIGRSSVSTTHAAIETNSATCLTVSLPLVFSFVPTRAASSYALDSHPVNVWANLVSAAGGCCLFYAAGGMLHWSCYPVCTCGGEPHCIEATATWEGYSSSFPVYAVCRCGEDAPDPTPQDGPYAASVYAGFGRDAVIFEDGYENLPGVWLPRRSTATTLTIHANGGPNGGVLSVSGTNLGKLQKNSGPAFPSHAVAVPAEQSVTYEINYVGVEASGTTNDIAVTATLTENGTGEAFTNRCSLTVVRLELAAVYEAPENPCTNRHVYGVGEKVRFVHYPESIQVSLHADKGDAGDPFTYYDQFDGTINEADKHRIYVCPIAASYTPNPTISYSGVSYAPEISLVEPQAVITSSATWEGCHNSGVVGQSTLVTENYIGPMTVSFRGIMVAEIPCYETNAPSGYFATTNFMGFMTHSADAGAGYAWRIQAGNRWATDRAGGGLYPNWSAGQLQWNVPIGWVRLIEDSQQSGFAVSVQYEIRNNSNSRPLLIGGRSNLYTQTFLIDADGTARIDKFGHWLSRGRYCRIILDGETKQWTHPLW